MSFKKFTFNVIHNNASVCRCKFGIKCCSRYLLFNLTIKFVDSDLWLCFYFAFYLVLLLELLIQPHEEYLGIILQHLRLLKVHPEECPLTSSIFYKIIRIFYIGQVFLHNAFNMTIQEL